MSNRLIEGLRELIRNAEETGLQTTWESLEAAARSLAERLSENPTDFSLRGAFNVAKRAAESSD